ncbi:hypothetical protein DFH27DRAFT_569765 [Peziza echinospora]|nr:hypothetical protein DFH27DRAFT_569765 [Peziza echinospora]
MDGSNGWLSPVGAYVWVGTPGWLSGTHTHSRYYRSPSCHLSTSPELTRTHFSIFFFFLFSVYISRSRSLLLNIFAIAIGRHHRQKRTY